MGGESMKTGNAVLCILGSMIGAGFASGREIMQFFTCYGDFSRALVLITAGVMTALMIKTMKAPSLSGLMPGGKGEGAGRGAVLLLLLCTGGGMTAAAGELWALTMPLDHARSLGMLFTLAACLVFSRRPVSVLTGMGYLLLPALGIALLMAFRLPGRETAEKIPSFPQMIKGILYALSYAGMNIMLSVGVLCDASAGCSGRKKCRSAAWAGGAIGGLLLIFNEALLPHADALGEEVLPMVMLLKAYGKEGYYLSAVLLYLAVFTTLLSVLRAEKELFYRLFPHYTEGWIGMFTLGIGLLGFEKIVAAAYPALGFFCFLLLAFPKKKEG